MKLAARIAQLLGIGACAVLMQGCKIDAIIGGAVVNGAPNPSTTLAWSEASTFTPDGRFFVIGGDKPFTYGPTGTIVNGVSSIYEVKKANGKYVNTAIVNGNVAGKPCYFGSLGSYGYVLYAICTDVSQLMPASVLYRVDTRKASSDPARVATVALTTPAFQPNGMAIDRNGDLYIPNYASFIATFGYGVPNVPAIVKVKVTNQANFAITETPWLPAAFGGFAPNGLAISSTGDQLYMPSLNVIYRIPILPGGSAGAPVVVYQAAKTNLFDNLTLLPGNLIAAPEITTPDQSVVQTVYPGTPAPTSLTNQITLIDANTGKKLGAAQFPSYVLPSSVTVAQGPLFPAGSGVVTDAIGAGGLYLIQQ
jgi:hypothetical protein